MWASGAHDLGSNPSRPIFGLNNKIMIFETVIGRSQEDLKKYGLYGAGYIGRYLVIGEYEWQLSSKIYFDFIKSHVVLICGKRGSGKSYCSGTILEEFCNLPEEIREKSAFIVFDPMGIYWSMKYPNEQQKDLLKQWNLEPKGFDVLLAVPKGLEKVYREAGLPIDFTISIPVNYFSAEDWILTFEWDRFDKKSIALEKIISEVSKKEKYDINDIIETIRKDNEIENEIKNVLISYFKAVEAWGIFEKEGTKIEEIVKPGKIVIIDVSRVKNDAIRNMIASWIARNTYYLRLLARKEEELAKMGYEQKFKFPIVWLVFEEAQNFAPRDKKTLALDPILTIAKQGREPGVNLICITQMPNKLHQDLLSQTDIVIAFRLTSSEDLKALRLVMQTYVEEELENYFNKLPRIPGAAIVLDDNIERIFAIVVRPRISWHAGGTATVI